MKWKNRRQSSNITKATKDDLANIITKEEHKQKMKDQVTKTAMESSALRSKNLKKHKDWQTDIVNVYNNSSKEQPNNARRLRQLKDTAKPKHLIPASKKQARVK